MPNRIFVAGSIVLGIVLVTALNSKLGRTDPGREAARRTDVLRGPIPSAEAAMASYGTWQFKDAPLTDVVSALRTMLQINVRLDTQAFDEEGIATDTPVWMDLNDAPLEVALKHTLQPLALAALVDRNVLVITTVTKSKDWLTTRVYPVYDLVISQTPAGERMQDYSSLIYVIEQETTGPWQTIHGEGGEINEFANSGSIVIRQDRGNHREIIGLLSALRKAKHRQQLPDIPVVIQDDNEEYRGPGFFSVEDEADESTPAKAIDDTIWSHTNPVVHVQPWQVPRVDRSK